KGIVDIATNNAEAMQKAYDWIMGICAVPELNEVYHGKVTSVVDFGAFVEILPGKEGLLHISEMDWGKTEKVEDVVKQGDELDVKLIEIDVKSNKLRLSRKALLPKPEGYVEPVRRPRPTNEHRGERGDRREGGRDSGREHRDHKDRKPQR
ncbi:MAG: S1 RNA-binding domain-containing protein, partial [Bacteroidales bacterium]|nr:S1 RNA-binding domain-containing protein [Bacteroidales bacterium]